MDSNVALALKMKMQKIFLSSENQDKLLTFPMGIGFKYEDLDFMNDVSGLKAEELRINDQKKANFARMLNSVTEDNVIYTFDASRFLWDEYAWVLDNAQLAQSTLTEDEKKKLKEAKAFLTDIKDGLSSMSPVSIKYYEYKNIYDQAEEIYLDEKVTVENSGDDEEGIELRNEWNNYREKELREVSDKCLNDWINLGYKNEVEKYQQIVNHLGSKDPYILMDDYEDDLEACYDVIDATGIEIYSTFYSPIDSFDKTKPWPKISMTKKEINSLLNQAPPELKKTIPGDGGVDLESIAFEYMEVYVVRPWFNVQLFKSNYWKLPDNSVISDGNIPRTGRIPAVITSMIVTRKIEVTRKEYVPKYIWVRASGGTPGHWERARSTGTANRTGRTARGRGARSGVVSERRAVRTPRPRPSSERTRRVRVRRSGTVRDHRKKKSHNAEMYARNTTKKNLVKIPPKRINPKEKIVKIVTDVLDLNGVSVLAYCCKRIPKSPNPNNYLEW